MIDALPAAGRAAAVGTVWALTAEGGVGDEVIRIGDEAPDLWHRSLVTGMSDPQVGAAGAPLARRRR